jgi:hypothetical protein
MKKREVKEKDAEKLLDELQEIKSSIRKNENEIYKARYGLGNFRVIFGIIFAALAIIITIAIVLFAIFGVTSFRDIQSISEIGGQVEGMKAELEAVNKAIQKASLKETIPLPVSEEGIFSVANSPTYDNYFVGFVKRESYETIHFSAEIKNMDAGEPGFFRFIVTDNKETAYSKEDTVVTPEYKLIEEDIDISSLENGSCKFAYSIKTKGKKGVFLRNIYIHIYSKLFVEPTQ